MGCTGSRPAQCLGIPATTLHESDISLPAKTHLESRAPLPLKDGIIFCATCHCIASKREVSRTCEGLETLRLKCGHVLYVKCRRTATGECVTEFQRHDVNESCPLCPEPPTVQRLLGNAAALQVHAWRLATRAGSTPPGEVEMLEKKALDLCREAHRVDSDSAQTNLRLGEALFRFGDPRG